MEILLRFVYMDIGREIHVEICAAPRNLIMLPSFACATLSHTHMGLAGDKNFNKNLDYGGQKDRTVSKVLALHVENPDSILELSLSLSPYHYRVNTIWCVTKTKVRKNLYSITR